MSFTDDDLKRLEEDLEGEDYQVVDRQIVLALLARLEAAEDFIEAVSYYSVAADDELLNCWRAWRSKVEEK
jgi:hypothetical protein